MKIEIYLSRYAAKLGSITIDSGYLVPIKGDIIDWRGQDYKVKRRYILFSDSGNKGHLTIQLLVKKQ